jgi:hypothetical protein
VFLVGCPRSGTTLLQRLLDAHPVIAVAPETHFIRRFWQQRDRYGDLESDGRFTRLVDDVLSMPEAAEMHIDAAALRAAAQVIPRTYAALFGLLLARFAAGRGAAVVAEKTPNHLLYMPTLEEFFPGARFIHIIRDPRAVVNSWRRVPWSTGAVAGDAHVWRRYIRTSWDHRPTGGSIHVVRYEALVRSPEAVLRDVCSFLQVAFDPVMLRFHECEPSTLNLAREPWKSGASSALYERSIEEWRHQLTAREIAEVERIACVEMTWLGYRMSSMRPPWIRAVAQSVALAVRRRARPVVRPQFILRLIHAGRDRQNETAARKDPRVGRE